MIAFGLSSLPAPHAGQFTWQRPHSTQVKASSTLLLPRSFNGLEADLLLLEIEVRQVTQFGTLEEHRDRRQHQVEVLGCRNQREEREDDDRVHPPVHAPADRCLVEPPRQQEGHHQRRDEQANHDRLDRDVRAQCNGTDERPPNEQIDDAARARRRQTA